MATTARKTGSGTAPPPDASEAETAEPARTGLSRAVIWTGHSAGHGPGGPGHERRRPAAARGHAGLARRDPRRRCIVWALIVLAAVTLAELTRRHHTTVRRYAIRQGKRGALAAGRAARRHGRALIARRRRVGRPPLAEPGTPAPPGPRAGKPPGEAEQDPVPAGAPAYSCGQRGLAVRLARRRPGNRDIQGAAGQHQRQAVRGHRVPPGRRSRPGPSPPT